MKSEFGVIVATVLVAIVAIVFGVMAFMNNRTIEGDTPGDSLDTKISDLTGQVVKTTDELALYDEKARRFQAELMQTQADIDTLTREREAYIAEYTRRQKLLKAGQEYAAKAAELQTIVDAKKEESKKQINDEESRDRRETTEKVDALTAIKTKAQADVAKLTADFDATVKRNRDQMNYQRSQLSGQKGLLADLTQREPEHANLIDQADGKVVASDPLRNVFSINLGTGSGVQNGFRFEVFTYRPGHKRKIKGYGEVTKAGDVQSECMVLNYPIDLPGDPLADYVAAQPEEIFSPLSQSGKKGASANRMTATKPIIFGQDKLDPIVEGDFIQNPFFEPNRQLTFYVVDLKDMTGERQKSAIRYTRPEIEAAAQRYGAKVVEAVDTNVNYVIVQKNPGDDPEYKKAVDLGIPIVYEWELFRFLDNR